MNDTTNNKKKLEVDIPNEIDLNSNIETSKELGQIPLNGGNEKSAQNSGTETEKNEKEKLSQRDNETGVQNEQAEKEPVIQATNESRFGSVNDSSSHVPRDTPSFNVEEFPEKVFNDLPSILKRPFEDVITKKQQRDLSLIVLLVSLSGMLPNYFTIYDGSKHSANLFLAIVAPFGEGKGFIKFIKRILNKTHQRKLREAEEDSRRYEAEMVAAEKEEKSQIQKPRLFRLLVPANNSKTGLIYLLSQNGGRGILFETEIDTLTEAVKQDYGNFSDLLRNAFQNEAHGLFRKTNNESIDIEELFVSVILSGTLGQLFTLIPSIENGLLSRFIYFFMAQDSEFHNVFDTSKLKLEEYFDNYATYFDDIHFSLEQRDLTPVYFEFQQHQQIIFTTFFKDLKIDLKENVNSAFGGVVNRLALMCYRIAQILAFYRAVENTTIPDKIICDDIDFNNALVIIKALKSHTIALYFALPKKDEESSNEEKPDLKKEENIINAKDLHSQGLSYRQISKVLLGSTTKHQTIWRWVNETA